MLDGKVFYVGKGVGARAFDKISRSDCWKAFVARRIDDIEVVIKGYFEKEIDAYMFETRLINSHTNEGFKLINLIVNHEFSDKFLDLETKIQKDIQEMKLNN